MTTNSKLGKSHRKVWTDVPKADLWLRNQVFPTLHQHAISSSVLPSLKGSPWNCNARAKRLSGLKTREQRVQSVLVLRGGDPVSVQQIWGIGTVTYIKNSTCSSTWIWKRKLNLKSNRIAAAKVLSRFPSCSSPAKGQVCCMKYAWIGKNGNFIILDVAKYLRGDISKKQLVRGAHSKTKGTSR